MGRELKGLCYTHTKKSSAGSMDLPWGGCEKWIEMGKQKGRMRHTRGRGRWGDGVGTAEHQAFLLADMEQWWGRGEG